MPDVDRLGVVGAGTMGAGIAQLGCLGGFAVVLHDPDSQALADGAHRLRAGLTRGAVRGLWNENDAVAASERLESAGTLTGLADCDVVIEAAPESLELKRSIFDQLALICGPGAVLATNTSSISVSAIAASVTGPERVCGMHFFNPPPLMRLVEIIAGKRTSDAALELATSVARRMSREPVRAADAPGFIVNRCNRPYSLEAFRMLGEGIAGVETIDRAMREEGGYRMGPFELVDLIGVDVNLEVARSFYSQRAEPRWEPHPIQVELVAKGKLGRKSGEGFYSYEQGRRIEAPSVENPPTVGHFSTLGEPRDILLRIVAQLINEASFAVEEGVAAPGDIDTAMRLGLNHPRGPFEWLAELGAPAVVTTLDDLAGRLDGERYRVAATLRSQV